MRRWIRSWAWLCAAVCLLAGAAGAQVLNPQLWWNDPALVEKLALTKEQRAKMDALLAKQPAVPRIDELAATFQNALEHGNTEAARRALAAWADASRDTVRARGALKIEVLSLLTEPQRKQLAALEPDVIARAWKPRRSWLKEPAPVVIHDPSGRPRIVQPNDATAPNAPPAPQR